MFGIHWFSVDMESYIEYSNIGPKLLTYQGKQYNHLRDVF